LRWGCSGGDHPRINRGGVFKPSGLIFVINGFAVGFHLFRQKDACAGLTVAPLGSQVALLNLGVVALLRLVNQFTAVDVEKGLV
jgi:hypothetical protein